MINKRSVLGRFSGQLSAPVSIAVIR